MADVMEEMDISADTPAVIEDLEIRAESDAGEKGDLSFAAIFSDFSPTEFANPPSEGKRSPGPSVVGRFSPATQPNRQLANVAASPALPRPRVVNNPYSLGLDRTLFERITAAYQRRGTELKGTDDFIRTQKHTPAKDLGELLSRGGTL